MRLFVCTDSEKNLALFDTVVKNKSYTVTNIPTADFRKAVKGCLHGELFYLDISSIDEQNISKEVNFLIKQESLITGLIDPKGKMGDIASLFHKGLSDYVGKKLCTSKVSVKRLNSVVDFKSSHLETVHQAPFEETSPYTIVNRDWSNVETGKEYTFLFLHIFFDNYLEIEKNYGQKHIVKMISKTRDYLESAIKPSSGKVWMWMEKCGLMLFPFDGKRVPEIELAYKLMLNRQLINLENGFRTELSYRLSMHIGNTSYQESGDTGNIVSDSVNSIFHLGNKFTSDGNLYMTEDVAKFIPERVRHLFLEIGEYEGRTITRMKLPLHL